MAKDNHASAIAPHVGLALCHFEKHMRTSSGKAVGASPGFILTHELAMLPPAVG